MEPLKTDTAPLRAAALRLYEATKEAGAPPSSAEAVNAIVDATVDMWRALARIGRTALIAEGYDVDAEWVSLSLQALEARFGPPDVTLGA